VANGLVRWPLLIASGTSISAIPARINATVLIGVMMPAAWDAAALTFQASLDGVTFSPAYDSNGTELTVTTAAGRYVVIPWTMLAGTEFLHVRSGTFSTPVVQTADRTLTIISRYYL
jgi:hypothetical protein